MKLLFALPFALLACVDSVDDEVLLDETSSDLTSTALQNWNCATAPYCSINLGSASNRTCFIAGIRGPAGGVGGTFGSYTGTAVVNNEWILTIYPPASGEYLSVTTACVKPGANRTSALWNTGFGVPSVEIPNTTASSRCFLNIVSGQAGGLTHYNDSIKTWKSGSKWYLGGTAVGGSYLSGGAVCFDVASNLLVDTWGQGVAGSITRNLSSNATGGVACGLTEIGGMFTSGDIWGDGVFINYVAGTSQWNWTLKNFKHGIANCIK